VRGRGEIEGGGTFHKVAAKHLTNCWAGGGSGKVVGVESRPGFLSPFTLLQKRQTNCGECQPPTSNLPASVEDIKHYCDVNLQLPTYQPQTYLWWMSTSNFQPTSLNIKHSCNANLKPTSLCGGCQPPTSNLPASVEDIKHYCDVDLLFYAQKERLRGWGGG
jgi:hypothetical protein